MTGLSAIVRTACRLAGLVALAGLAGCANGVAQTRPPVEVTDAQAGTTVDLSPRQPLVVRLPANPSTGYAWSVEVPPQQGVLRQDSAPEFVPGANPTGAVGVGGTAVFHFTAAGPGQAKLRFEYRRPWEKGIPPVQTLHYTVFVR